MGNEVWRSKEREIVARYADRLAGMPNDVPHDDPVPAPTTSHASDIPPAPPTALGMVPTTGDEEITFNYANGVAPPRDLLNYKNMELEMAIWARTGVGWMSVIVLAIMTVSCFLLSMFLNLVPW